MASSRGLVTAAVLLLAVWSAGCGGDGSGPLGFGSTDGPAPNGAELTGIDHGDKVSSPFTVGMETDRIKIAASGEVRPGEGHFHILVDEPCVAGGTAIPTGDAYHHFDRGENSAELDLEPGKHDLCLQVGDGAHVAIPPPPDGGAADMTHEIEITVED